VALIEKYRIGGDCTWTGCVPSKALIKAAKVAHEARTAAHFGLTTAIEPVNLKTVMDYVRKSIAEVYQHEEPGVLQEKGLEVFLGAARFADAHTLNIALADGEKQITAKNIIICSGGRAYIPPVEGLSGVNYINYDTVFDMEILPQRFLVMGGGPIGIEMA